MRTAELAHQSPDRLAHGRLDEVELHQSRPLAEMAGFTVSASGHFQMSTEGPQRDAARAVEPGVRHSYLLPVIGFACGDTRPRPEAWKDAGSLAA